MTRASSVRVGWIERPRPGCSRRRRWWRSRRRRRWRGLPTQRTLRCGHPTRRGSSPCTRPGTLSRSRTWPAPSSATTPRNAGGATLRERDALVTPAASRWEGPPKTWVTRFARRPWGQSWHPPTTPSRRWRPRTGTRAPFSRNAEQVAHIATHDETEQVAHRDAFQSAHAATHDQAEQVAHRDAF